MRIVVASAHFPPNFVSGGTRQPQLLARELRRRGHDVFVYAGWLGDRPAGEGWSEIDETGLPVRWIASSPWIGWADRRNFDNPVVARDFAAFLDEIRPDIVHLHSLQSLGAGLLGVAKAAGARVVVTMHDFWWCCARQFLVDRDLHPCSLVVDAGACSCEVDHAWLLDRNRWLATALGDADLVLAPSASAAEVFAANGLAVERLEVDENGLVDPPLAVAAAPLDASEAVRFLYAGGSNELKGVHVVLRAAAALRGLDGWRLDAYGADEWAAANDFSATGLPVQVSAPFTPAQADRVFAAADVLVVPSIMRESHSVITREAMQRGLAVVCSDCIGPEEVVTHGQNGLVVPTGDVAALRDAMRALVVDRGLLARLRAQAPNVTIRSLAAQVDALETRYDAVLAGPPAHPRDPLVKRVLFIVGIDGAPLRYRVQLPAEALRLLGVESGVCWFTDPQMRSLAAAADAVVVYRVPATTDVIDLLTELRERRHVPMLFDADDLIFDPAIAADIPALSILPAAEAALWLEGVHRYRTTMEHCDVYIASTEPLAAHARAVVGLPVERFDNGVGLLHAQQSTRALARARAPGPLRLGYFSGTNTHDHDWTLIEPAVVAVLEQRPTAHLWLGGHLPPTPALTRFGDRVTRIAFRPWYELPGILRDVDVNLSPLVLGSRFNEAKSAIKWLEAALVATPTVASPTAPLRDAISHDENGLLATTTDEWTDAILRLLDDEALRVRLGSRAQRDALLRWSPHRQGAHYLEILERAQHAVVERPARESDWTPVVVAEPAHAREIEPYLDHPEPWTTVLLRRVRAFPEAVDRVRHWAGGHIARARRTHGIGGAIIRLPRGLWRALRRRVR